MSDLLLAQGDPTGFSSPLGRIVVLLALVSALVVLLRWWCSANADPYDPADGSGQGQGGVPLR